MSNKMKAISLTPKRLVFAMLYHWNSLSVEFSQHIHIENEIPLS